ncbi:MAG: alpha/beta fold hydrolase [Planctomycetota bacterium]
MQNHRIWRVCLILASLGMLANTNDVHGDADPLRPPAISTTNVPPLPAELVDRLRQYQNTRAASFQGWAPDGSGIVVGTRFGNTTQLHRVHEPGGRREQITFFDEPVSGRFLPGGKGERFLVTTSKGGDENYQVLLFDRATGATRSLTDGKSRNLLGPVREDGSQLVIGSNKRNGRDTDLYLSDPSRPGALALLLEVDGEHWSATSWSPDGKALLLNRYVSINETYPAILDLATRTKRPLAVPNAEKAAYGGLQFSHDGKSVYLTTDVRGEFRELAKMDLETGSYQWLTQDIPWDVEEVEVDPKSGRVAFTVNADGASKLYLLENGSPRREFPLPLGIVDGVRFSPDGKELGFTFARPDAPADAYSLQCTDGTLTRWTYSEVGGLNPEAFISPSLIRYDSFDGRKIPAYFFKPRNASEENKAPVLISIHGGPESQYRPVFSGFSQMCAAELGIAVIAPNVRGSAGYGKTYLKLDNGPLREDSVRDIGGILDWIATQPDLDAKRVAVIGGSYGGYMVLASLTHFGDRLKAGVDIVGIANFITFLEQTSSYRQDLRRAEYGDERDPEMRKVFEKISPAANAERIQSALLVAHGVNDPASHSRKPNRSPRESLRRQEGLDRVRRQ